MERLIIDIPEQKSTLVKQILTGLGISFHQESKDALTYKQKIAKVSTWDEESLQALEQSKNAFNKLQDTQW